MDNNITYNLASVFQQKSIEDHLNKETETFFFFFL